MPVTTRLQAEQQRRVISECCNRMPLIGALGYMDREEKDNLLILLYRIGILSSYLEADDIIGRVGFCQCFDITNGIKVNPYTGRIIFLRLHKWNYMDEIDEVFDLPPFIEYFQSLEEIDIKCCRLIPIELGNLPSLKYITFDECSKNIFKNIPERMQFPSSIKCVYIYNSEIGSALSSFLKLLPNTLEELWFNRLRRRETDEIVRVLQNDNFGFRQNLTTIRMINGDLNERDLDKLLFEIRSLYPNLCKLDVSRNCIKSFLPIKDRINKELSSQAMMVPSASSSRSVHRVISNDNNTFTLNLLDNPVMDQSSNKMKDMKDMKEKNALLFLLNTFKAISNLGWKYIDYDPDVEHVLRINHAGREFIMGGGKQGQEGIAILSKQSATINRVLWPKILERAYKKSAGIYFNNDVGAEIKEHRKCASGLFHLVKHCWPLFMEDRLLNNTEKMKKEDDNTTKSDDDNSDGSGSGYNKPEVKRKRKRTH
jgi:hypothetical protein